MQDFRSVIFIIGLFLAALSAGMLVPALIDYLSGHHGWRVFLASAAISSFVAGAMILTCRGKIEALTMQQAFALTGWSWIMLAMFAALPFAFSTSVELNYSDAFFEAMSGLTTTGATVMVGLDNMPKGILLWRAMLQWFGGIGIIVMAIAVLPMLNVGGMQLFRIESSDTSEKILPRATEIAGSIARLYLGISMACALAYMLAGMDVFDAIAHAMTTIATGGFSTSDNSIGGFNNMTIDMVAILFMLISSLPFAVYLQAMHGNTSPLFKDTQIRTLFALLFVLVLVVWIFRLTNTMAAPLTALREVLFNVTSILTGTGYATASYDQWGTFATTLFLIMAFIGGCAGSTACGLKIFRFNLIVKSALRNIKQLVHPSGVFAMRYNDRTLGEDVIASVMTFAITYFICFALIATLLGFIGLDTLTAISASASTISNVGPGLGAMIGPDGNYMALPQTAKWVLCLSMLLGRLELFTILVMLTPTFWRR